MATIGRKHLPADCETAEDFCERQRDFHNFNAQAFWWPEKQRKAERKIATEYAKALSLIRTMQVGIRESHLR